jgi:small subunit ribosomal protein S3
LIEEAKKEVKKKFFGSQKMKVNMTIQEVANPEMNAELILQSIRDQLEQRVPFRRAMKRSMELVMRAGAKGCRLQVSGRLNGAEIARRETMSQGRLPLHTLRANIDYTRGIAQTLYGVIGIKVWIYKGDVFEGEEVKEEVVEKKRPARPASNRRKLQTGGNKQILRKKADVDADAKRTTETVTA